MRPLPDLPVWAWLIVASTGALALVLPLWMLWRIPVYRRVAHLAKQRGTWMHLLFWILFVGTYLLIALLVVILYWENV
jgi:hypothetical protein